MCSGESALNKDVQVLMEIIEQMGAKVRKDGTGTLEIDSSGLNHPHITNGKVKELRASYYLLGALLARFKEVSMAYPGGCDIGLRPIDQHIKGFKALGRRWR
jgi:UDP-N-acetylglucosamine 1-carboxyvinyltransferase